MFWVISVYFNIRNTLPKAGPFLLEHPVYRGREEVTGDRGKLRNKELRDLYSLAHIIGEIE